MEDDLSLQGIYKKILETLKYEVIYIANNGEEAVSLFKSFSELPDLIIMDHRMPIKNGIEATKELLEIDANAKILFASADISVREEALSLGIHGFLEKPFKMTELKHEIEYIVFHT